MRRPIKNDKDALLMAAKVIEAQYNLLAAYRIGGRPPEKALNTLTREKPRLRAYLIEGVNQ